MARRFVSWEEIEGGWLPAVCVRCGRPADHVVDWRVQQTQHRIISVRFTTVTVRLPVCEQHVEQSWNGFKRVTPRRIDDEGIDLDRLSPAFAAALDDYRRDDEALSLFDEDVEPVMRPTPPGRSAGGAGDATKWIVIGLALFIGLPFLLMFGMMVLMLFAVKFL